MVQIDQEAVKITALKVIFDFLHMFGLEAFEVNSISDEESMADEGASPNFEENDEDDNNDDDDDDDNISQSRQLRERDGSDKLKTASSILHILVKLLDSEVIIYFYEFYETA